MTQWIRGCKVDISDWYDGVHDHLNIAYYKPGAHLDSPEWERGFLILKSERSAFKDYLDSIVNGIISNHKLWVTETAGKLVELSITPPKIHL